MKQIKLYDWLIGSKFFDQFRAEKGNYSIIKVNVENK